MLLSLEEAMSAGLSCQCVTKHVPLPTQFHRHHIIPMYLGGTNDKSNFIVLCPTTHYNIHSLLQKYARHKGTPPGSVRKHYSDFVQRLAKQAWDGRTVKRTVMVTGSEVEVRDPWWDEQALDSHHDL